MIRTFGAFREADDETGLVFHGELLPDGLTVRALRQPFWFDPDDYADGPIYRLSDLIVGLPVVPSKIIAVGRNYHAHAAERGETAPTSPLTWLMSPSSLLANGGTVELPFPQHRVDFEAELVIVIGKVCKNVPLAEADDCIFGYTVGLDISDRTIQDAEGQFARAKGFDTFNPLGPFVYSGVGPDDMAVTLHQNGELRQNGHTGEMIFRPQEIVAFVSQGTTLLPGDVIFTGTPAGVGPIQDGDELKAAVGPFEPLIVRVRDAAATTA